MDKKLICLAKWGYYLVGLSLIVVAVGNSTRWRTFWSFLFEEKNFMILSMIGIWVTIFGVWLALSSINTK